MSGLPRDFWTFWAGQTISAIGSSITQFALPLLVYQRYLAAEKGAA